MSNCDPLQSVVKVLMIRLRCDESGRRLGTCCVDDMRVNQCEWMRTLMDIAVAQDNDVGDGTMSVLFAVEFLKEAKGFIQDGGHLQIIIRAFSMAQKLLVRIDELSINNKTRTGNASAREVLERLVQTALQSKLIFNSRELFGKMEVEAVDAVMQLDGKELDLKLNKLKRWRAGSRRSPNSSWAWRSSNSSSRSCLGAFCVSTWIWR